MTILVGGGLTDAIIKSLYAETSLHAFHVGKAARIPQTNSGKVHRSMVRDLVGALT
jgi:copper homeostasis protein CutC